MISIKQIDTADIGLYERAVLSTNELLELHILPTEKCNFRCTYCYESFDQGRMTNETIASLKKFMATRIKTLKQLNISWFGGEPLVAKDVVIELTDYAKRICEMHDVRFRCGATTNAWYLTSPLFAELVNLGINSYQITLDGPQPIHDQYRLRALGAGSFARIWQNLLDIRDSSFDFAITLRLHIRPDTIEDIIDWMPELRRTLLYDERFQVLFKPVEKLGGPNDDDIICYEGDADRHAAVERLLKQLPAHRSALRNDIFGRACYAGRPNAWVIRANGDLAKCTVALESEKNRVGYLRPDGTLELYQEKLQPWFKGLRDLTPDIIACPAQYV